jgi:hypothetical protein
MIEENKNIDNYFRDKLKDFTADPPPEIWEGIRAAIPSKEKKFLLPVYWKVAAGFAILTSIGLGIFRSVNKESSKTIAVQEQTTPNSAIEKKSDANDYEPVTIPDGSIKPEKIKPQSASGIPATIKLAVQAESNRQAVSIKPPEELIIQDNSIANRLPGEWFLLPKQIQPERAAEQRIQQKRPAMQASWEMIHAMNSYEEEAPGRKDLEIGALASPIYAFRDVSGENSGMYSNNSSMEKGILSYAGGMQFGYAAGERLTIYTGLAYSRMGVKVEGLYAVNSLVPGLDFDDPQKIYAGEVFYSTNSIGTIESKVRNGDFISSNRTESYYGQAMTNTSDQVFAPSSIIPENRNLSQYFHYLEIPLMLKYKLIDRDIDINFLSGLSSNFLVGNKIIVDSNGEKSVLGETGNIRSQNFSGNLGLGFDYNISPSILLSMEPQFRYYLNSINNPTLITSRPFSFGMFSGVRFIF